MLRNLHGEVSDTPCRAGDQHALSGDHAGFVDQRLQSGATRDRQRCGGDIVDAIGDRQDPVVRCGDEFGQRAVARERQQRSEHTLPDVALRRATANADDLAGEIAPQPARGPHEYRDEAQIAGADFAVERIEAHGADAHFGLSRPRQRLADILDPQHVGRTIALEPQRAHRRRLLQIERVLLQRVERDDRERFLVGRRQHDRRRDARLERLPPRRRAYAPAIAGLEAGEAEFGHRGDQVVALTARELEKRLRHLRADDMQAVVLRPGVAAPVAVEAGQGDRRAWLEWACQYIAVFGGNRGLPSAGRCQSTTERPPEGAVRNRDLPRANDGRHSRPYASRARDVGFNLRAIGL